MKKDKCSHLIAPQRDDPDQFISYLIRFKMRKDKTKNMIHLLNHIFKISIELVIVKK